MSTNTDIRTTYRAGSPWHVGTDMPRNVTGECAHAHRTVEAAERCIEQQDRSIKRGHGGSAYSDRVVMVEHDRLNEQGEHRHRLGVECSVCDR